MGRYLYLFNVPFDDQYIFERLECAAPLELLIKDDTIGYKNIAPLEHI